MAKQMTLKDHALSELKRLAHVRGFPKEPKAIEDYLMALMVMETFEGVTALMDDLASTEWIDTKGDGQFPQAAMVRRMAYERTEALRKQRGACAECGGSGFKTVWFLITYHGMSLAPKKHERLRDVHSQDEADEFSCVLQIWMAENPKADRQMVVSAAENCGCRNRVSVLQ
jgi:hypothetical protein